MKNWSRLILPLGLGVLATVINASAMTNRLEVVELVACQNGLRPGEKFKASDLFPVKVSYPAGHLKNHFWTWAERDLLVQSIGTPTQLNAGDLVPRGQYRHTGPIPMEISDGQILIGMRISGQAFNSEERHLLLPGREIRLRFEDGNEVRSATLAFLDVCSDSQSSNNTDVQYQMGILLPRDRKDEIQKSINSRVNRVVGLLNQPEST